MSSSIVMESSSKSNDIDTSMVNGNVNEEEEEELLLFVLPEDIVFQILLWLPVVSLLRFKSVCKSWCSLIQTSRFISQHKHKDTSHNNLLLMLPSPMEVDGHQNVIFKVLSSSCGSGGGGGGNNNNNKFQTYENLDLPEYFKINNPIRLVICDGVICLHHLLGDDVSLWNPATKQFRILPRSQLPPMASNKKFIGFGIDVETNDYKVVRVRVASLSRGPLSRMSTVHTLFMNGDYINQIEVYSLTNNSWKSLDFVLPVDFVYSDPKMPLPYHNGGIYCWMGRDVVDEGAKPRILSFDFSKEIFGTISLPNDATFHESLSPPKLAILREKLAIITITGNFRHYQIWVMNEFGVRESWTKLYTVGLFVCSQPLGFPKNEDLLVLRKNKQICLCDPVTGQINNLPALDNGFYAQARRAYFKSSVN